MQLAEPHNPSLVQSHSRGPRVAGPRRDTQLRPIDRVLVPFRRFAAKKPAGAILLLGAAILALILANSPWADTYAAWLHLPVTVGVGPFTLEKPFLLWINDGLMGVFFFVVGLEIKREMIAGELASLRMAVLPMAGALGGVLLPATIYLIINAGTAAESGWGVPMATDIAFALGVLALLGDRVPLGLKIFLTALAIVDEIAAIAVIGIFYTESVALSSLAIGAALLAVALLCNRGGVRNPVFYFLLGSLVWLAFLKSGVHATLAAVLMAFTIPARTRIDVDGLIERLDSKLDELANRRRREQSLLLSVDEQHLFEDISRDIHGATPPLQRIEHALLPLVTFLVLPIFALANAGVVLGESTGGGGVGLTHPVAVGVMLGLLIGKPLGIFGFAWLAVKLKLAELPTGVRFGHIAAVGLLGGIGFTMALFIGGLAFVDPVMVDTAKMGILAGSTVAGVAGFLLLRRQLA